MNLIIYGKDGSPVHNETFGLPAFSQRHFGIIDIVENGCATITTVSGQQVSVESVTYDNSSSSNTRGSDVFGRNISMDYNTFLEATNLLKVSNVSSNFQDLTAKDPSGQIIKSVRLAPRETIIITLPNEAFASDTYDTITLEQDTYGALMSEVIREGRSFSLKTK